MYYKKARTKNAAESDIINSKTVTQNKTKTNETRLRINKNMNKQDCETMRQNLTLQNCEHT